MPSNLNESFESNKSENLSQEPIRVLEFEGHRREENYVLHRA